jgi:hypothetical protein
VRGRVRGRLAGPRRDTKSAHRSGGIRHPAAAASCVALIDARY